MRVVTVFRHVPAPIIGIVGTIHDRAFQALEATLDWLETTGMLVERFDPVSSPAEIRRHPVAAQLLSKEGDACLPLVLVDEHVASQGRLLSRATLARAIGEARRRERHPVPADHTRSAA